MGEKKFVQELTTYDILTVILYRAGIIISALAFAYSVGFVYTNLENRNPEGIFAGSFAKFVFWLFVFSVNLSISFLHLYSKKILKGLKLITYTGTLILVIMGLTNNLDYTAMLNSEGWQGKIAIFGLGLVLAGFGGIGAKEAYCFKLFEGYIYSLLLAFTVLLHLFGLLNNISGLIFLVINTLLIVSFAIRKLFLPLYYDIGDKSRY